MGRGFGVIFGVGALLLAGHVGYMAGAHGAWRHGFMPGGAMQSAYGGYGSLVSAVPHGQGRMPPAGYSPNGARDLKLGVADVKSQAEGIVARLSNPRLKLGEVKEVDADFITADIVTKDSNSLVERLRVDRHTGFTRSEEN